MSNPSSTIFHPCQASDSSTSSLSYEDSYLRLLREITRLQWVRESFPSHSKYYDGLQQKRQRLQKRIEKHLAQTTEGDMSITMESLQHELRTIQEQITVADDMLQDLLINKRELDAVCDELHALFEMLLVHRIGCTSRLLSVAHYSTKQIPKKAAGAFTSNKYITQPVAGSIANKTLVYIGPFADTMQRYKMVASLFGACGLCAVPALLSTGQPSILSVILAGTSAMAPALFIHWYTRNIATKLIVYDDVKTVEQQRRRPREINTGKWIGIELPLCWVVYVKTTCGFLISLVRMEIK